MEKGALRMIKNLNVLPELGRQRCFELGNPFYYQDAADLKEPGNEQGNFYRKELPTGENIILETPFNDETFKGLIDQANNVGYDTTFMYYS